MFGHPRRDCKVYLGRMGKGQKQDVAAFKGAGKHGRTQEEKDFMVERATTDIGHQARR